MPKPIVAIMTRTVSASGMDLGDVGGSGRFNHYSGCHGDLVCSTLHRKRLCDGKGVRCFHGCIGRSLSLYFLLASD